MKYSAAVFLLLDLSEAIRFIPNVDQFNDMPLYVPGNFQTLAENTHAHVKHGETPLEEVEHLARHIPVLDDLQSRIPVLNGLDPKLQSIDKELEDLGDMSDMKAAAIGGKTIERIYAVDKVPGLNAMEKRQAKTTIKQIGEVEQEGASVDRWTEHIKSVKKMDQHVREIEKDLDIEEVEADKVEAASAKVDRKVNAMQIAAQKKTQTPLEDEMTKEEQAAEESINSASASGAPLVGTSEGTQKLKDVKAEPKEDTAKEKKSPGSPPSDPSGETPQAPSETPEAGETTQPLQSEAVPTPLSVSRASLPLQPLTGKEQDPAYLRVPKAPTNFAAELKRYQGISKQHKAYLNENQGEDPPSPIPAERPTATVRKGKQIMMEPTEEQALTDGIAAKIRQGVENAENARYKAQEVKDAAAKEMIGEALGYAKSVGVKEAEF